MSGVTTTWHDPTAAMGAGGLDLATGDTPPESYFDAIASNFNNMGGVTGGAALVKIAEVVLAGTAASITFSTIPQTYRHLRLVLFGRCDNAATSKIVALRVNADTGNNYDYQYVQGNAATPGAAETFAAALITLAVPAASAPANVFGQLDILFAFYAGANNKTVTATQAWKGGTSTGQLTLETLAGFWRSNAAITSISLTPYSGADNFVAGTIASLYGCP
jgi:hypothetical protein